MTPAELAALHERVFTTPRPFSEAEFTSFLAAPECYLCAEPGGFALGRVIAGEAELLTLAVAPDMRRQGIGRLLLGRFEQAALGRSADTALLEVAADNVAARHLYAHAGYDPVGLRKRYYRAPDGSRRDALVLRKALVALK